MSKPNIGQIFTPASDIVHLGVGLPRTVTALREQQGRYVVFYKTAEGEGSASDSVWMQWVEQTGASAS